MMDHGGHGVFAGISKFFDNEEKPAYATGSMSVTAGSVTVTGLGAPGAASGVQLPAHPHTPTPGASADGYVDPWRAAFEHRDQALSSGAPATARQAIEAYYGKPLTDSEYKSLINATSAEAGVPGNPQEQAMITASILNRAKTDPGGIEGGLHAPNQFQSVTGTALNGHQPSAAFLNGPDAARLAQIENGNVTYLPNVSREQLNFTAASASAFGPGTDIGYRNGLLANGGSIYGGSVFNTALPTQIPNQLAQNVTPQLTQFTSSLASANTGLTSFSGGLGDAISKLLGGLGGGGGGGGLGGLGSILSGIGGLFSGGFADGGMIQGVGSGTSDSNLAIVSDGEFIVNAGATAKNKQLLNAINSGRAPRFGASVPSVSNVNNSRSNSASTTRTTTRSTITSTRRTLTASASHRAR